MAKSDNLGLEILDSDANPNLDNWVHSQNGNGEGENKSNAQLIDEFAGNFVGGSAGQVFVKSSDKNYEGEWKNIDNGGKVVIDAAGVVTQAIQPDKFYLFTGTLTSLIITLASEVEGRENEFKGQFATGSSAPTVSFPETVSWVGGAFPTIEANKTYQFSILGGIGVIVGV